MPRRSMLVPPLEDDASPSCPVRWAWHAFAALSPRTLYAALALRAQVFVVEQRCAFQDLDGLDEVSLHLFGWGNADVDASGSPSPARGPHDARVPPHDPDASAPLLAYLRLVPPGAKYAEPSLGRVCTATSVRRTGLGHALMAEGLAETARRHPAHAVRIGAQRYLERFYASHGFVIASAPYDEDGISHVEMTRDAASMRGR